MDNPLNHKRPYVGRILNLVSFYCGWPLLLLFPVNAAALTVMATSLDQAVAHADYIVKVRIVAGEAFFFDESVEGGLPPCGGVFRAEVLETIKGNPGQEITFGAGYNLMPVLGEMYLLFLDERGGSGVGWYMLEPSQYADCTSAFPDLTGQWRTSSRIYQRSEIGGSRRLLVELPNGIDLREIHADWPNYLEYAPYVEAILEIVERQATFPLDPSGLSENLLTERGGYPALIFVSWPVSERAEQGHSDELETIGAEIIRAGMAKVVEGPVILDSCRDRYGTDVFYVVPDGVEQSNSVFDYWRLDCQPARPNNLTTCLLMPGKGLWSNEIDGLIDVSRIDSVDVSVVLDLIPVEMDFFGRDVPLKRITRTSYGHLSMTYGFCECSFYHSVAIDDWENPTVEIDAADFSYCE
ncbi:MAG: hypothetical protein ACXIUB_07165 [Wenzhouxiangella sp.]